MTFKATHAKAFTGTDLTVDVTAGEHESLATVQVTLDGMELEELELASGTESYSRTFAQVGESAPGMDHTLVVTVTDTSGAPHGSTTQWTD